MFSNWLISKKRSGWRDEASGLKACGRSAGTGHTSKGLQNSVKETQDIVSSWKELTLSRKGSLCQSRLLYSAPFFQVVSQSS